MSAKEGNSDLPRLITIGPSHYCEKARWALERAFVPFSEEKHAPAAHIPFTKDLPGGSSCPKLVIGKGPERVVIENSHDIVVFADKKIDVEENRLYPTDPEQLQLVQSWESKFDDRLGPHVRRYAYSYLLFDPSSYKLLTQGSSTKESSIVWFMMPVIRRILYRTLGCHKPGKREQSLQAIETVFTEVDVALSDGRPYICGSKFTAADLTFAALGGPLVAPPQLGSWMPKMDQCPAELASTMKRFQATAAGKHILKVYATQRQNPEEKQAC